MRVMISMDTHSLVDGASKAHTLKRYLTDLKDENTVNTSSLRCRELDCLRAFYYVAILMFLKEHSGEVTSSENVSEQPVLAGNEDTVKENHSNHESALDNQKKTEESANSSCVQVGDNHKAESLDFIKEITGETVTDSDMDVIGESAIAQKDNEPHLNKSGSCDKEEERQSSPSSIKQSATSPETVSKAMADHVHSSPQTVPLNISHLVQLSQGILWDLQAKRFALTETLGYIHKAISQLLLSKTAKPTESHENVTNESETQDGSATELRSSQEQSAAKSESSVGPAVTESCQGESGVSTSGTSGCSSPGTEGAEGAMASKSYELPKDSNDDIPASEAGACHHHYQGNGEGHICHSVLSHHFDHMLNMHRPHRTEVADNPLADVDVDVGGDMLDICSSCQILHKTRKILWEDEPHFLSRQEGSLKDTTSLVNPAKYINVPDEWYNMTVDQKYFKPYVTMAILKDEQEYVMHELKRGPDITQVRLSAYSSSLNLYHMTNL